MGDSKPRAYIGWFCPYARRVWIAFVAKGVEFEYIEQNPNNKTPEWMAISPTGLVPVIIHEGNTIYESSICVEYIDEAFKTDVSLMPKDPYQRAYARIWGDFLGKKVIPHFYASMVKPTEEEREEAKRNLLDGLKEFTKAMSRDHVYFQQESLGYVDIMLAPFCNYLSIMKESEGFEVPNTPDFTRFHKWVDAVSKHPAVATATPDYQKLKEYVVQFVEKRRAAHASGK